MHEWFLLKFSNDELIASTYRGQKWKAAELDRLRRETEAMVILGAMPAFYDQRKETLKDEVEYTGLAP